MKFIPEDLQLNTIDNTVFFNDIKPYSSKIVFDDITGVTCFRILNFFKKHYFCSNLTLDDAIRLLKYGDCDFFHESHDAYKAYFCLDRVQGSKIRQDYLEKYSSISTSDYFIYFHYKELKLYATVSKKYVLDPTDSRVLTFCDEASAKNHIAEKEKEVNRWIGLISRDFIPPITIEPCEPHIIPEFQIGCTSTVIYNEK